MLPLLACAPEPPAAIDLRPARRTLSPDGAWEARVDEAGVLSVGPPGALSPRDHDVDPRVAFRADQLAYAREGALRTTDLYLMALPGGIPRALTSWPGSEDRPTFSPDGRRLAFVADRDGVVAWWVIPLDPPGEPTQLTNLHLGPRRPGHPPEGFLPVPDGKTYAWTDAGLTWVADHRRWTVASP